MKQTVKIEFVKHLVAAFSRERRGLLTASQLDAVERRAIGLAVANSPELSAAAKKSMSAISGWKTDGRAGMLKLLRMVPKNSRHAREMIVAVRAVIVSLFEEAGLQAAL